MTKTEESQRDIPLIPKAKEIVREAMSRYHFREDYLFENNSKRIRTQGFRKHFNVILKKCDIEGNITIHSTRKFFASYLHKNKLDDETIRKLLGHTDIATTRRCYISDIDDDIEEAYNALKDLPLFKES